MRSCPYGTHAVYSEYGGAPGLSGFIDFVTGAKWRSGLKWPSLEEALAGRTLTVLTVLLRQWMLPLWLCMPLAFYFFLPRFPATAGFCLAASLAFVGFVYVYDIPDPDGLVIALACCLAPSMGVAVQALRHSRWAAACVLCAVAPTAALHVTTFRDAVGYDVLEDVVGNKDREALDMPDIVQRLPDGAYFMLPCTHYGCVQVMNYYRFADAAVSERKIQIAQLLGGRLSRWHSSPPVVAPKLARSAVVCTVHERERALLASVGTVMRKIERGELRVGSRVYPRIPLYCSEPSG